MHDKGETDEAYSFTSLGGQSTTAFLLIKVHKLVIMLISLPFAATPHSEAFFFLVKLTRKISKLTFIKNVFT